MVVMDEDASSGAGAVLESIQLAYLLLLSDPRQEQRQQLEAVAVRYGKDMLSCHLEAGTR
jgi:hypothetical protein